MLSKLFTKFDMACHLLQTFKLYTIGDCYVALGFIDKKLRSDPKLEALNVLKLGFKMLSIV
jgi:hypothetical protein